MARFHFHPTKEAKHASLYSLSVIFWLASTKHTAMGIEIAKHLPDLDKKALNLIEKFRLLKDKQQLVLSVDETTTLYSCIDLICKILVSDAAEQLDDMMNARSTKLIPEKRPGFNRRIINSCEGFLKEVNAYHPAELEERKKLLAQI